jgi:hypothetical protein
MAATYDGTIRINSKIDTADAQKGISTLSNSLKRFASTVVAAFAVKTIVNFGKECIDLASDLTEVQNIVDTVFGAEGSSKIEEFSSAAAEQFGLSELAAKQYTSTLGAMLDSMGLADGQILEMSTSLAGLAGDMASFYNLDPEAAFEKLRSGISGETEPLKQLGINLSQANLSAFALSEGMETAYSKMTEAEKATTRYNYIMSVTANAQGDFAKTSDSVANQQRILSLNFDTLKATIGEALLPVVTKFLQTLNGLIDTAQNIVDFIREHKELFEAIAATIGVLTIAIIAYNVALNITTITTGLATVATVAFEAALGFLTSPITLIVLAITALIIIILLLIKNWDKVKEAAIKVWDGIKKVWGKVADWFSEHVIEPIVSAFEWLKDKIVAIWDAIWDGIKGVINGMLKGIESFINFIISGINLLIKGLNNVVGTAGSLIGKDWTISEVSLVSLPRLAKGAVIPPNREFAAVLGDQKRGTNIEAPLETIKQAVAEVIAQMGGTNSGSETLLNNVNVLKLDGRTIYKNQQRVSKLIGKPLANRGTT